MQSGWSVSRRRASSGGGRFNLLVRVCATVVQLITVVVFRFVKSALKTAMTSNAKGIVRYALCLNIPIYRLDLHFTPL